MATILWSSLNSGDAVTFDPTVDILSFDDPTISAANLFVDSINELGITFISVGDKTVTFLQMIPPSATM